MNTSDLASLAEKSDDQLYALLGMTLLDDLGDDGYRVGPRQLGREWYARKRRDFQDRICDHQLAQPLLGNSSSDTFIDVLTIGTVVQSALRDSGLDAIQISLVTVLVARSGLHLFCADRPAKSDSPA